MSVLSQPAAVDAPSLEARLQKLRTRTTRMLVAFSVVAVLLVAAVGSLGFLTWRKSNSVDSALEDAAYYVSAPTTARTRIWSARK
jgi:nitrate reductase NapE component